MFWIGLIVGLSIGSVVGFFAFALAKSASESDREDW